MNGIHPIGLALLLLLAGAAHSAPVVWRCDGDGARGYADQPCPRGRAIETDRDPGQARLAEALAIARREQALADSLAEERRAREHAASGQGPAGIRIAGSRQGTSDTSAKAITHIGSKDRRPGKRKQRADALPKDPRVTFQVMVPSRTAPRQPGSKTPPPRP